MKNITLSVDDEVLDAVRRYAAERNTTVNSIVRHHLEQIARNHDRRHDAIARMRQLSETSAGRVGPKTWIRDDLYDR
jgi:predicted transcriptional regulator